MLKGIDVHLFIVGEGHPTTPKKGSLKS